MDTCGSGSFAEGLSEEASILITRGTKCQKCWQEDTYKHGVFSYYLLGALSNLAAVDTNRDYSVSADELFNYVSREITSEFELYPPPSLQPPQIINNHEGELILFHVTGAETITDQSDTVESWWHKYYKYFLAGVGIVAVATGLLFLIALQRKEQG